MANARLHIICGNCGCNDEFIFEYIPEESAISNPSDVLITCRNCSTIHSLSDNAELKEG